MEIHNISIWNEHLSKLCETDRKVVLSVLTTIMHIIPEALPSLPYGVPGFTLKKKSLIAVAGHKEHYGIYPFSPAVITAVTPMLGSLQTAKGTIRFPYDTTPSKTLLKKIIQLRVREIG